MLLKLFTDLSVLLQDAFHAFHQDLHFVRKFLKPLLIGELAPEEPSQDGAQNVREQLEVLGTLPVASISLFCIIIGGCRLGLGLDPPSGPQSKENS